MVFFVVLLSNSARSESILIHLPFITKAIKAEIWTTLLLPFVLGAVAGVCAGLATGARGWQKLAAQLREEREHNRKLEAANRALEAAVPVLREPESEALEEAGAAEEVEEEA